jgi:hypothetical protein
VIAILSASLAGCSSGGSSSTPTTGSGGPGTAKIVVTLRPGTTGAEARSLTDENPGPAVSGSDWTATAPLTVELYLTSSATVDQIKAELRHLAGSKYVARTAVEF